MGDDDSLPADVTGNLLELTKEKCDPLTVFQLKKVRSLIDEAIVKNNEDLIKFESERDACLREMGNWLHPSVPVSNDEVTIVFYQGLLMYCTTVRERHINVYKITLNSA